MKSDCFTQSEKLKKSIPIHLEAAVRLQTPFKKLKEKHPRRSFFSKISGHRSPTLRQKLCIEILNFAKIFISFSIDCFYSFLFYFNRSKIL